MAKNKRAEQSIEDIQSMISSRWKPARDMNELEERAKIGKRKFLLSKSQDLNEIWKLFKKYPEVFYFDEYVKDIIEVYRAKHVSMSTDKCMQESNMCIAVEKMKTVAQSIYSNMKQNVNKSEDKMVYERNNNEIDKEKEEEKVSFLNIFDDEGPKTTLEKSVPIKKLKLTEKIKEQFKDDPTPITSFKPANGEKMINYLLNTLKIATIGDYFTFMLDKKRVNAFYQKSKTIREEYDEFMNNVLTYVSTKLGLDSNNTASSPNNVDQVQKKRSIKKDTKINSIEDIRDFEASKFEKDSKEMDKISKLVNALLDKQTDEYLYAGLSEEEVSIEMDHQIKIFREIVDEKRAELKRSKASSIIKARIAEGVKYKNRYVDSDKKTKKHDHNPFVSDELTFN